MDSPRLSLQAQLQAAEGLSTVSFSYSDDRDYRSVLYSALEDAYRQNPYFAPIMEQELSSVKRTLQFMVEKEGKKW